MADAKRYKIVLGERLAEIELRGVPQAKDVEMALKEVQTDRGFRLGMSLLLVDQMSDFNPGKAWIEEVVRVIAAQTRQMDNHVSIVVESELHYGIAMQFAEIADPHGLIVMPFREIGTARNWLIAQQSDSRYFPIPPTPGSG